MKANVIFSNFFNPEKAKAARKLLDQLHIEISDQNDEEELPKIKIITKSINEIPFNGVLECLTITPLCLQQIILMNTIASESGSKSDTNVIKSPFDLQKYGNFFYNLFLLNKNLSFGNISEEEKERLSKKIIYMGGKIVSPNDKNINYILTEKKCENPYNVPLILPSWIDSLFESSIEISTNRFRVDENEITSANGSPNINASRRHILLSIPDKPSNTQSKSFGFKSKGANSQPVSSLKGKSKRTTKALSNKLDSRQMILNFEKKTTSEAKPQPLALSSSPSMSQTRKPAVSSQAKLKTTRKSSQLKSSDNVMKIDNFMKPSKEVYPSQPNQLIVTVEGENIDDANSAISDNDDGSNDEAINEEVKSYEKKMEKRILRSINNNSLRAHGKPVDSSKSSDEEDQNGPLISAKSKLNEPNKKSNEKLTKNSSLKKVSMIPSIINEMTEDAALSSDNEPDYFSSSQIKRNSSDSQTSMSQFESMKKDLIDFSSDFDSKSPKRVTIQSSGNQFKIDCDSLSNQKCESELFRDLTSFSQSSGDVGESQTSFLSSSVYYDSGPKKVADGEDSQKTEMLGKDPLIDCWDMFQDGVDTNSQ